MHRLTLLLAAVLAIGAVAAPPLVAQEDPGFESPETAGEAASPDEGSAPEAAAPAGSAGWSGPGFYLSLTKVIGAWLIFLLWAYSTDWVSRDCQALKLEHLRWNPIVFGVFLGGFVLVWLLPWFVVSFPLLLIAYAVPFASYVVHRNKKVESHQRVFTRDHLRHWLATRLSGKGVKIETEARDPRDAGPPVNFAARGGATERDDRANLLAARQAVGFRDAKVVIADALVRRAMGLMLEYTQQGVAVRYLVDGVWHNGEPLEREVGDPLLETFKILCGLNPEDRASRQTGLFTAEYESVKYAATFASQGTPTGERVLIQLEDPKVRFDTLDRLGMRPAMQEQLTELLKGQQGIILFSAIPGAGLRSTTNVALRATDRFTRDFVSVEDVHHPYQVIENVKVKTYNAAEGQSPASVLRDVFLEEPEVVVVRDLVNAETVRMLCDGASDGRLIVSAIRAKDCAEALLRVLALKAPPAEFAENVTAVLSQRLVRKLCEHCKEAYVPTPQTLAQLGIPQGRVDVFYRPPQHAEEPCAACSGIGYVGRTAIFELLVVNPAVRKAVASNAKLEVLRQAARKAGMRTLQEEGIVLVAKGITSLPELSRVLKQ